jgi:hypothetical protein
MSYENLNLNELRDECRLRGLEISGGKQDLVQRLKDYSDKKDNDINSSSDTFSLSGLIVSALFGYIAYKFFPIVKGVNKIYEYLNSDELPAQLLLEVLESVTDGKFSNMFSFFNYWFWAIFISYCIKTIISFKHSFNPSADNITTIGWTAMILEVLPIFFKVWSINSFGDAFQIMIVVYIPTIIGIAILHSKEISE